MKRLDTLDKLTGKQVYGADLKMPGMLSAADQGLPGARRQDQELRRRQGHEHAGRQEGRAGRRHGVAVVADTWWQAKTALDALPIVWDEGENAKVSSATIAEWLKAGLDAREAFVGNQNGDAKARSPARPRRSRRSTPIRTRTTPRMEPMNATALYTADKCEVWGPTQNGEAAFAAAAGGVGPAGQQMRRAQASHLGGGFGRRGAFQDYVTQAVHIAKQMPGTPVKLLWSREEDMTHGRYHPVMQCKLAGGFEPGQQPDRPAHAAFRPIDPGQRASRNRLNKGRTRSPSRASCRATASTRSATRSRTC